MVIARIAWPSQEMHEAVLDLLRTAESDLGLSGNVSPPPGTTETSADDIAAAEKATADLNASLIAAGWTPPTVAEASVVPPAPEPTNAFSGVQTTAPEQANAFAGVQTAP